MADLDWPLGGVPGDPSSALPFVEGLVARLAKQFRQTTTLPGLVRAFATEALELRNAIEGLAVTRDLANLTGAGLDALGEVLGRAREGRSDAEYKLWLAATILANRSDGTPEQLLAIARGLGATSVSLSHHWPKTAILDLSPLLVSDLTPYGQILQRAAAAATRIIVRASAYAPETTFTLDGTPAQSLDAGHLCDIMG